MHTTDRCSLDTSFEDTAFSLSFIELFTDSTAIPLRSSRYHMSLSDIQTVFSRTSFIRASSRATPKKSPVLELVLSFCRL
jgi:hypothetical protein